MKEAILKIRIDDRRQVSVSVSVDGVEERLFWGGNSKYVFSDAIIAARKWLLELRKAENGQ